MYIFNIYILSAKLVNNKSLARLVIFLPCGSEIRQGAGIREGCVNGNATRDQK